MSVNPIIRGDIHLQNWMFLVFILCKFPWHIHNNIKKNFLQVLSFISSSNLKCEQIRHWSGFNTPYGLWFSFYLHYKINLLKLQLILLIYEYTFGIMLLDTFEKYQMLSLSYKRKVVVNYDKKRIISIYYNSTIVFCSNHLTI